MDCIKEPGEKGKETRGGGTPTHLTPPSMLMSQVDLAYEAEHVKGHAAEIVLNSKIPSSSNGLVTILASF